MTTGFSKLYIQGAFRCMNFWNSVPVTGEGKSYLEESSAIQRMASSRMALTVVNHLEVKWFSFINIIQVFHSYD